MKRNELANQDFERAVFRAFFRKISTLLTGKSNKLLPFDEVRAKLPIRGQHHIGVQQVPIEHIVGSFGRYHDFDRAFLPTQSRTKDRWVSIDQAHYDQVILPPVELFKVGGVYFVKDGNHRVSVARERGQLFIDAYVTEMDVPVPLTTETSMDDLEMKSEYAEFLIDTQLGKSRPEASVLLTIPGNYAILREHIAVHRWYLGEQLNQSVPYHEAAASWYDNVYLPLVDLIREQGVLNEFPRSSEADLYLWITEYRGYLRRAYKKAGSYHSEVQAIEQFVRDYPHPAVRRLINILNRADWMKSLVLNQERALFLEDTQIHVIRPQADITTTVPGQYDRLEEHIAVHRWYLGEQRGSDVPYGEAVASWHDQVYAPLVRIIREQEILKEFPGRTETDLYLWVIEHQSHLHQLYGSSIPMEQAAEEFTSGHGLNPVKRVVQAIKKITGGGS